MGINWLNWKMFQVWQLGLWDKIFIVQGRKQRERELHSAENAFQLQNENELLMSSTLNPKFHDGVSSLQHLLLVLIICIPLRMSLVFDR